MMQLKFYGDTVTKQNQLFSFRLSRLSRLPFALAHFIRKGVKIRAAYLQWDDENIKLNLPPQLPRFPSERKTHLINEPLKSFSILKCLEALQRGEEYNIESYHLLNSK